MYHTKNKDMTMVVYNFVTVLGVKTLKIYIYNDKSNSALHNQADTDQQSCTSTIIVRGK